MLGAMDRAVIEATLGIAEKHVAEGARHIAKQKELIAEMVAHGVDVTFYRETLATFETTQRLHIQHVSRLKRDLLAESERRVVEVLDKAN
jgi:hypothetical protein